MYVCIILLALCRQLKSSHFHRKVEKQYAVYVLQCNFNGRGNWYNSHRAIRKEILKMVFMTRLNITEMSKVY